jgi:CheY-like chemotaxis protein
MQVLINFVTNARDAMPDGGTLSIKARNILLTEEYHSMTSLAPPGRYVAIDVEDDGEGMSTETQSKIFEPFFTTKPHGEGTGLGLPTSMAIVRSHGGSIQVYSEPGNGTRFQLHVPAADEGAALEASPPSTVEIPHGSGERILIVDDEVAIRQIVQQTLAAHGYETLEASNGREAMDLIETGGARVDLVLTDMMMPVMDGAATARYLLEKHPDIAVVAASGLNANGGVQRVRELGVSHFIAKPFTTDALLRTLREALDER